MMISARANSVCGECRSAKRAMRSKMSRAAPRFMRRPAGSPGRGRSADSAGRPGSGSILRRRRVTCTSMARSLTAAAHALAQRLAAQHLAQAGGERAQQRDLGVGERHALALLRELAQVEVELIGPELHLARGAAPASAAGRCAAARSGCAAAARAARTACRDNRRRPSRGRRCGPWARPSRSASGSARRRCARSSAGEVEAGLARHHDVEHDQVEVERCQALARLRRHGPPW